MSQYSLTVVNKSELAKGSPTFAVMAELPEAQNGDALSTAWLTQVIHPGNSYTFTWDIEWGFAWSASGTRQDYTWRANGHIAADPTSASQCAAEFDYTSGDFMLTPATHVPAPDHDALFINDSGAIPKPSTQPSSVAVTLDGQAVCVVDAGPNVQHQFTLHPTYYIVAGSYKHSQMVDAASLTQQAVLSYQSGIADKTAVLDGQNIWHIQNSSEVDLSGVLLS
ncbi:hypothetical protein [Actinomadura napierensis]|uniref:Uncharacterized protein n=1 Tax=Actinomadura napierensis TaxID=267854 RepID=A0ABN3AJZ2_9ACTN